jgi:hypothetical protein
MVVTPTLRGMFGLEWNARAHKLTVTPQLPAQWNEAKVSGLPLGESRVGVEFHRDQTTLLVHVTGEGSKN